MLPVATEMIKQLPGYKVILKAILKAQIQMLVDQLLAETDEETVVLTASLTDGTLSDLGSAWGRNFLEGQEEFKTQFLCHCLKGNQTHDNTDAPDIQKSTTVLQKRASQRFSHSALMPTDQNSKRQNTSLPTESFLQPADNIDGIGDDELSHNTAISVIQNQENEDSLMSEENELENHDSERDEHYTDVVDDKSIKTEQDIENIAALAANNSKGRMPSEVEETQLSLDQNELQSVRGQSEPPCNILSEVVDKADEDSIVVKVEPEDNDDAVSDRSQSFHEPVPSASQGGERKKRIVRGSRDVQKAVSKIQEKDRRKRMGKTNSSYIRGEKSEISLEPVDLATEKDLKADDASFNGVDDFLNNVTQSISVTDSIQSQNIWPEADSEQSQLNCRVCNKTFTRKDNFKRHQMKHSDGPKFHCNICNHYFRSENLQLKHMAEKHETGSLCSCCGLSFKTKQALKRHTAVAHATATNLPSDISLQVCPFNDCGRKFTTKIRLEDHMNIHTSVKPYLCCGCGKAFGDRYRRTHHENICTGKQTITCQFCSLTFSSAVTKQRHINSIHFQRKHHCVCGKVFAHGSALCRHKKEKGHYR